MDPETHRKRTLEGVAKAAVKGRFPGAPRKASDAQIAAALHLGTTAGALAVGLTKAQFILRRRRIEELQR